MMVLINRKFNEEQFLFESFSPKMHIEQKTNLQIHSMGLEPPLKKPNACFRNYIHGIFSEKHGLA